CFGGETPIERAAATLKTEPPPLAPSLGVPHEVDRIVRRCLEKDPARRFQSTRDLLFDVEGALELASTSPQALQRRLARSARARRRWIALLAIAVLGAGAVGGALLAPRWMGRPAPRFQRVTF